MCNSESIEGINIKITSEHHQTELKSPRDRGSGSWDSSNYGQYVQPRNQGLGTGVTSRVDTTTDQSEYRVPDGILCISSTPGVSCELSSDSEPLTFYDWCWFVMFLIIGSCGRVCL